MTLTASDVAMIATLRDRLPKLNPHDRDYVLGHAVALYTAGIPNDAQREFQLLESLVIQFGWRLAYCRYVERFVRRNNSDVPMDYEEWKSCQKKSSGK